MGIERANSFLSGVKKAEVGFKKAPGSCRKVFARLQTRPVNNPHPRVELPLGPDSGHSLDFP